MLNNPNMERQTEIETGRKHKGLSSSFQSDRQINDLGSKIPAVKLYFFLLFGQRDITNVFNRFLVLEYLNCDII